MSCDTEKSRLADTKKGNEGGFARSRSLLSIFGGRAMTAKALEANRSKYFPGRHHNPRLKEEAKVLSGNGVPKARTNFLARWFGAPGGMVAQLKRAGLGK